MKTQMSHPRAWPHLKKHRLWMRRKVPRRPAYGPPILVLAQQLTGNQWARLCERNPGLITTQPSPAQPKTKSIDGADSRNRRNIIVVHDSRPRCLALGAPHPHVHGSNPHPPQLREPVQEMQLRTRFVCGDSRSERNGVCVASALRCCGVGV